MSSLVAKVFIDGQEGTTGLEIHRYLDTREDIVLMPVDHNLRKDPTYKRERYAEAAVVVLCLPDGAAREAVELDDRARFLDASTAHRTAPDWTYGLPELSVCQRSAIKDAQHVSNPGCYPTGFLLAVRPLIGAGIVPASQTIQVHAISGYSGGGKKLITQYSSQREVPEDTRVYGLDLNHKHVPEMLRYSGLQVSPFFLPSVGSFYRGMIVKFALPNTAVAAVHEAWTAAYENEPFVKVLPIGGANALQDGFLSTQRCNCTNRVDLLVSSNGRDSLVCAILDNLGKGAAGGAVQNLNLMLGFDERTGLSA